MFLRKNGRTERNLNPFAAVPREKQALLIDQIPSRISTIFHPQPISFFKKSKN